MRVLLLEDDPLLGEGLRDYLRAERHVVEWCTTLAQARSLMREPFDALLVDWQLPDGSGMDWVRGLRASGTATPVLMLTARDRLDDRIKGLDSGADDYLVKPFAPEELEARMRAVVRRSAAVPAPRLSLGEVELDLNGRAAFVGGRRIDLTGREWSLLEALALRRGRIVSKVELDRLVLGMDAVVASNALEVHVSSLRRKLGRELIETVRGLGYRISAGEPPA